MAKVSVGLRGWRFDEADVFDSDGSIRPLEEMSPDTRERILRLSSLVGSPCDACWLVHGDENLEDCNAAAVVYGEPFSEIVLCGDHETDFLYWYRESGGSEYRGSTELADAFQTWFAEGGRAPEGYEGLEHVDTDPENIPAVEESIPSCTADSGGEEVNTETETDTEYPSE